MMRRQRNPDWTGYNKNTLYALFVFICHKFSPQQHDTLFYSFRVDIITCIILPNLAEWFSLVLIIIVISWHSLGKHLYFRNFLLFLDYDNDLNGYGQSRKWILINIKLTAEYADFLFCKNVQDSCNYIVVSY